MSLANQSKVVEQRLAVLALANQLGNITLACRRAGISRSHYYKLKKAYERFGPEGLAPRPRPRPRMPNETPREMVVHILRVTAQYPTRSYVFIAHQLWLAGVEVTPSTVRAVWRRCGLSLRRQRLLWLERKALRQHVASTARTLGPLVTTVL
jgi:transposase